MENYYDIDDLLSQEQKITVAFANPIKIHNKTYKKNKKIELPIYIVDFFIKNNHCRHFILSQKDTKLLKSDCTLFNFQNLFFYNYNKYLKDNFLYELFCTRMQFYSKFLYEDHIDKKALLMLEHEEKKIIKNGRRIWRMYN